MSSSEIKTEQTIGRGSIGQPALSLALTFLLIGLTFAIPAQLVPPSKIGQLSSEMANEVGNVYGVVAWAGLAHFFYAYRGQFGSKTINSNTQRLKLFGLIVACVSVLWVLRRWLGYGAFGALTWTYFIHHFHKAESFFEGTSGQKDRQTIHVIVTFAWLSVVLLNPRNIIASQWVIWLMSLGLGSLVLADGGLKRLTSGDPKATLLSLFFIAESLVWGTYGRYGGTAFLFGVYVFHIAAGSYYHYLGAYFAGFQLSAGKDRLLKLGSVFAINLAFVSVGILSAHLPQLAFLQPVFGVGAFTLWVASHLAVSDLFPLLLAKHR